jgi:hypothetical protein
MSKEPPRQGIPFERPKNKKKPTKTKAKKPSSPSGAIATGEEKTGQKEEKKEEKKERQKLSQEDRAIPEAVSRRMVTRMVLLSGIPLLMALFTFVGSYFIITNEVFPLPNQAVLIVSLGFFGLSVIGVSYGIFSASWEEETTGSLLGWQEFTVNFGRTTEAWRSAKKNK